MRSALTQQFMITRHQSLNFCAPLTIEDYGLQAIAETSPPKWHLAHTTWFFETFLLKPFVRNYQPFHPLFEHLFNSYYNGIGSQHARNQRGLLSRPGLDEVLDYRTHVDAKITDLIADNNHPNRDRIAALIQLGINHEQQHQELLFTDIKYSFFQNPLYPAYSTTPLPKTTETLNTLGWMQFGGDIVTAGYQGDAFCFDNEQPAHQVVLPPFQLANRLITNGEFQAFIDDGGYQRPELWLADGWAECQQQQWCAPLYWVSEAGQWLEFTLHGLQKLDPARPVCHISAYEADAFARWSDARLPTEFELEQALKLEPIAGQFVDLGEFHPGIAVNKHQLYGTAWEWTSSAYNPYPGYRASNDAIGEYNGKFMCNQLVLKGGSCVTSQSHLRHSYRNFFYPKDRWQFSGIRLAKNTQ